MVKIEVDKGCTTFEMRGKKSKLYLDVCFAMNAAVDAFRQIGERDELIRKVFEICMDKDK